MEAPCSCVAGPVLGVGCATACPPDTLETLARATLAEAGVPPSAVACVATLDRRAAHPAVLALARSLGNVPVHGFPAATLDEAGAGRGTVVSERVRQAVGCTGVAEGAALAAIGPTARLRVPRRSLGQATCALAVPAPRPLLTKEQP